MRRLIPLLLATCCAAGPAMAAETFRLCFERAEVLPWRTLDNHGLDFDLLAEVSRRTGVQFRYESMPWKRCLAQLRDGLVDGAFAVSFNPERAGLGVFPGGAKADPAKRLHFDRYMLVRPRGSKVEWDGKQFRNLDGRVGFQLGYSVGYFLHELGVPVDEGSQQADELVQKLLAGRVAIAALGGGDAARMKSGPMAARVEVLPLPLVQQPYYLALSRARVRRDPQLAGRIWDAIEQVRNTAPFRKREHIVTAPGGR